jgi:hypothetical protein
MLLSKKLLAHQLLSAYMAIFSSAVLAECQSFFDCSELYCVVSVNTDQYNDKIGVLKCLLAINGNIIKPFLIADMKSLSINLLLLSTISLIMSSTLSGKVLNTRADPELWPAFSMYKYLSVEPSGNHICKVVFLNVLFNIS